MLHVGSGGLRLDPGSESGLISALPLSLFGQSGSEVVEGGDADIALIGAFFTGDVASIHELAKVFGTLAISSFLVSIAAAAILLLTLPEIAQNLRAEQNIWLTRDSVAGRLLRVNTQGLALIESVFFGIGLVLLGAMLLVVIWT